MQPPDGYAERKPQAFLRPAWHACRVVYMTHESDGTDYEWCFHGEIEDTCRRAHLPELRQVRENAQAMLNFAMADLRSAVRLAVGAGQSEVSVANEAGVDRMTVRAWLGK